MATPPNNVLVINGILQTQSNPPVPPVTALLTSTPGAAYTTTRTSASGLLFWDRHLIRLRRSVDLILGSGHRPCGGGGDLTGRVNESIKAAMDVAASCYTDFGGAEVAVTVIVVCGVELNVMVHLGLYVPDEFGAIGAKLALAGKGRGVMAEAKYSDWVRRRKEMEKMRPPGTTELLLSDDGDQILEGSVTNFFVVCRKDDDTYEVQTAPVSDRVLPGVIRQAVIEACMSNGIPFREAAPSWADKDLWEEAFITSSLRLVQHVEKIQVPTSCENLHLKTWNDVSWSEKQFQGAGAITTLIQMEVVQSARTQGCPLSDII